MICCWMESLYKYSPWITVCLVYFMTSYSCLRFSLIPYKYFTEVSKFLFPKHPRNTSLGSKMANVKTIGHRGCVEEDNLIENTISAFKHAIQNQCDMIEFDLQLTKDRKIVVFHDETFDRLCGKKGKLNECLFKDLPQLIIPDCLKNQKFSEQEMKERFFIPTFEELLAIVPMHVSLIVEFKENTPELIDQAHELIRKSGKLRTNTVLWYGLSKNTNKLVREYDPSIPTMSSVKEILLTFLYYQIGLLPFIPLNYQSILIFSERIDIEKVSLKLNSHFENSQNKKKIILFLIKFLLFVFGNPLSCVPKISEHLRKRGIGVWFLGVHDDDYFDIALKGNATAIFSDYPKWLQKKFKMLEKKGTGLKEVVL